MFHGFSQLAPVRQNFRHARCNVTGLISTGLIIDRRV